VSKNAGFWLNFLPGFWTRQYRLQRLFLLELEQIEEAQKAVKENWPI
jgi:hypothetical protein